MRVQSLVGEVLDLLLPRSCLGCRGRITPEEGGELVCHRCRTLLRRPPPPRCQRCDLPLGTGHLEGTPCLECEKWPPILRSARAAVVLEPPAQALVHALKYGGWRDLAQFMGRRMIEVGRVAQEVLPRAVVVPVATTPARVRVRGYNQAQVLAQVVAAGLGRPLVEALVRSQGRTQVSLAPGQRRINVEGTFRPAAEGGSRIEAAEVILVDDVLTTGATMLSAAETLERMGAESVRALAFARALPFDEDGERQVGV